MRGEEVGGFGDGHVHDIADAAVVVFDFERGVVVAEPAAIGADHVASGEEGHFVVDDPVAAAGFAAAAFGIEGEAAGGVAADLGGGERGEERADFVEDLDVSAWGAAAGFADGGLVDLVDRFETVGSCEGRAADEGFGGRAFEFEEGADARVEDAAHERAFAAAADAGDDGEAGDGDADVDVLEIVSGGSADVEPCVRGGG